MLAQTERLFEVGKLCVWCGEVKDTSEFNKHSRKPDGLQPFCKSCNTAYGAKWAKQNPDSVRKHTNKHHSNLHVIYDRVTKVESHVTETEYAEWRVSVGLPPMDYIVYRFYCEDELVYVGRTESFQHRMYNHFARTPWIQEIDKVEYEVLPNKLTMVYAENALIALFQPKYNKCRRY
jgi:hypothetical protein